MTPERWRQVKGSLEIAMALIPQERMSFLRQLGDSDLELRQEVESLLSCESNDPDFLQTPALRLLAQDDWQEPTREPMLGRVFGAYRLTELLGAGGMGDVFRAVRVDGQYEQQVALKIVRSDYSRGLTARFRDERQILARLDHPNIASILDGGTSADGIPYIVMELIEGLPLTEYCHQQKLSSADRLKLFRTVCSAVHYAHQHLVVHRDIKPSNILVTGDGTPKLLDFGIAKILRPNSEEQNATRTGFLLLTPEYASPEQLRGEAITTATDLYSLGLVLYELLTGRSAFPQRGKMPHEIARGVLEMEPERPSEAVRRGSREEPKAGAASDIGPTPTEPPDKLSRLLSGDLDSIVLKALAKQPRQRYSSADQLSEDIRRHLERLPVLAREGTLSYRVSKYLLRHKTGVASVALIFLTLVGGIVFTMREARIAQRNELRAERRFNDVRKLANSLIFEIHDSIRDLPGATAARKLLVNRALEYLDSISQEAASDPALQRELASAYARLGDVQGNPYRPNLGDTAGARQSYKKALALRQSLAVKDPEDNATQRDLASSYDDVGGNLWATGQPAQALEMYRKSLLIRQRLLTRDQKSVQLVYAVADSHNSVGDMLAMLEHWNEALEEHKQAVVGFESALAALPQNIECGRMAAITHTKLGNDYQNTGDMSRASPEYDRAVTLLENLLPRDPTNALLQRNLANAYLISGDAFISLRDPQAVKRLLKAKAIDESLAVADPADKRIGRDLALIYGHLAGAEEEFGSPKIALHYYALAVQAASSRAAPDPQNSDARGMLADAYRHLGDFYRVRALDKGTSISSQEQLWNKARASFQNSLEIQLSLEKQFPLFQQDREIVRQVSERIKECDKSLAALHDKNR